MMKDEVSKLLSSNILEASNRRIGSRVPCSLRGYFKREGRVYSVRILNVSLTGLKVVVPGDGELEFSTQLYIQMGFKVIAITVTPVWEKNLATQRVCGLSYIAEEKDSKILDRRFNNFGCVA